VVRRAYELGINFFDSAEMYNEGRSESSLGQAIQGIPRDKIVIGTKLHPSIVAPELVLSHCEDSLNRLDTDYIDLYMIHWPMSSDAVEGAFTALRKLREQGKIRYIGVSNFAAPKLKEALDTGTVIVGNQLAYSLVARAIEYEVLPLCRELGIGVMAYMPLWQGLLSDRYTSLDEMSVWRRRTRHFDSGKNDLARHGESGAEEETWQAVLAVRELAGEVGLKTAEVALRWVLAGPGISCVLAGARNSRQLEANVQAAEGKLPAETVLRLAAATDALKSKLGLSCDYFEGTANDRTR
jgi:aryl-alcohol dehydrogenase-like predicted oxidoreductase